MHNGSRNWKKYNKMGCTTTVDLIDNTFKIKPDNKET
jgi:hypothetical protein